MDGPQDGWRDDNCGDKRPFICKIKATPDPDGNPIIPDTSTMPPTNNCGYMGHLWTEEPTTGMCYSLVKSGYILKNMRLYKIYKARQPRVWPVGEFEGFCLFVLRGCYKNLHLIQVFLTLKATIFISCF